MKGFFSWFRAGAKIKRWIVLILIGIVLTCYAFSQVLVNKQLQVDQLLKIIMLFVAGFACVIIGIIYIQKRTLELFVEINKPDALKQKKSKINISSLIFDKKIYEQGPKVVVIGGGNGINTVVKGLKKYTTNITAIVTMSDSDTVATESRKQLNILPLEDIKNSIVSLSDKEELMTNLMNLKFTHPKLKNLSFGDIYLLAMSELCGNVSEGIKKSTEVLNITGQVIPVTLDEISICAELNDGTTINEEEKIPEIVSKKVEKIKRIYISPSNCKAAPGVIEAIESADAIIIGPGSLYTQVLPNLLVKNVSKAIKDSKAIKIYITNIMTEPGQTDNYSVSDHIQAIIDHAGKDVIKYCICDTGEVVPEFVRRYNKEGSDIVEQDISKVAGKGVKIVQKNMSCIENDRIRHNPDVIAGSIIELICNDLKFRDKHTGAQYLLLNSILEQQKKREKKAEKARAKNKRASRKIQRRNGTKHSTKGKFSSKYKERLQSIQNSEKYQKENLKMAQEKEKLENKVNANEAKTRNSSKVDSKTNKNEEKVISSNLNDANDNIVKTRQTLQEMRKMNNNITDVLDKMENKRKVTKEKIKKTRAKHG